MSGMKYLLLFFFVAVGVLLDLGIASAGYKTVAGRPSDVLTAASPGVGDSSFGGASPTPTQCVASYSCSVSAGATIVPGTIDTGNHTDDGVTNVAQPFAFS